MLTASLVFCVTFSLAAGHTQDLAQVALTSALPGVSSAGIITPELSSYVQDLLVSQNVSGFSLGIVRSSGETEFGAWGNKTEDGEAMTSDTLFNLASCSKAFAAASVGILMDDFAFGRNSTPLPPGLKEFNWDTKVKDILPGEWEVMDNWADQKANIRDILSHVSGLPRHEYSYGPYDSPKDVVRRMKYLRPAFELRQHWHYNNQMYILASHIVSTYSGPYMDFVKERIFTPLEMTSTFFSPKEATKSGKLTQSWTCRGRRIPFWFNDDVIELQAAAAGITSSAEDMVKWLAVLLNSGVHPQTNETILPLMAFNEMTTAYTITDGKAPSPHLSVSGYGMGWWRTAYRGHEYVHHTGAIPGFSTRVAFLPSDGLGMVLLLNVDEKASVNTEISFRVVDSFLNVSTSDVSERPKPKASPSQISSHVTSYNASRVPIGTQNYSGTYTNPGYGAFTICDPSSTSFYCSEVLADFDSVDSAIGRTLEPQLFAAWPRIWSTHMRFTYRENNTFESVSTVLYPHGYGHDSTPFQMYESGDSEGQAVAEFVVEGGKVIGFGLMGTVGEMTERERLGATVQEKADAWFVKV